MSIVTTADLETWANSVSARHQSGELVRRLIHASLPITSISMIRFLANEATQLSGWDGTLSCIAESPWIPDGNSVWELGVGANDKAKVKSDFNKRKDCELPVDWIRNETTYVAVSFCKFNNKVSFENDLKKNSNWKKVVIIDSASLEEWIENLPNIQAWFRDIGVIPYISVESLSGFWERWVRKVEPEITESLMLYARDHQQVKFLKCLKEDTPFTVESDSPEESLAFSYSVLSQTKDEDQKLNYLINSIVVSNTEDIRKLKRITPLNVFLIHDAISEALVLAKMGHKVIIANGRKIPKKTPSEIKLQRLNYRDFSESLQQIGLNKTDSEKDSRACGASIGIWRVWKQYEFGIPESQLPNWSESKYAEIVIPAVLIGGWDENINGDREIVNKITGMDFRSYSMKIQPFLHHDNPLMTKVGSSWVVTASALAFALVARNINTSHLERFKEAFKEVFTPIDMRINFDSSLRVLLPPQELHSDWLRDGLAETLLKFSVFGDKLEENYSFKTGETKQYFVNMIISELTGFDKDIRVMKRLNNQMSVLAEAAPTSFLKALESLIQNYRDDVRSIFEDNEFYNYSSHVNFLFSLEVLAWEPKYFTKVCLILLELAIIDPGGKTSNRPLNSLEKIFLSTIMTNVPSLDERLNVLNLLARKNENITWKLMQKLLLKEEIRFDQKKEPIWKDFSRSKITESNVHESNKLITEYLNLAISLAKTNKDRWIDLIKGYLIYSKHYDELKNRILKGLFDLEKSINNIYDRHAIWLALYRLYKNYVKYIDIDKESNKEEITQLNLLLSLFAVESIIDCPNYLFDTAQPEYPDIPLSLNNYNDIEKALNRLRKNKIENILATEGISRLIRLLKEVKCWYFVIESIDNKFFCIDFFEKCSAFFEPDNDVINYFFSCISRKLFNLNGDDWNKYLVNSPFFKKLQGVDKAILFLNYPDSLNTYELIKNLGKEGEKEFWKKHESFFVADTNTDIINFACEKYIENGRSIELPLKLSQVIEKVNNSLCFQLLENIFLYLNCNEKKKVLDEQVYCIIDIFDKLSYCKIESERLIKLEYQYIDFLQGYDTSEERQLLIHKVLSENADYFIEIIAIANKINYKEKKEVDYIKARMLLHSWRTPPGILNDNNVDIDSFKEWVFRSRKLAKVLGEDFLATCDYQIGKIIFFLPEDEDDREWPHRCVRQLLEDINSTAIEEGLESAVYGSRGCTIRGLFEGGKQEKELQAFWGKQCAKFSTTWPKFSEFCSKISVTFEREAVGKDEGAKKNKLRFR